MMIILLLNPYSYRGINSLHWALSPGWSQGLQLQCFLRACPSVPIRGEVWSITISVCGAHKVFNLMSFRMDEGHAVFFVFVFQNGRKMRVCVCVCVLVVSNSLGPHGLEPTRLLCPWDSPGKNIGVGCHFLLQGIFLTQESNPGLLHCREILYHLSHWWLWSKKSSRAHVLCNKRSHSSEKPAHCT